MFKILLVGIWVSGLASGSVYYFFNYTKEQSMSIAGNSDDLNVEHVNVDNMNIPIIRNSKIVGYLVMETTLVVDSVQNSQSKIPIKYYANDVIINTVHSDQNLDIYRLEEFDLVIFQKNILANINTCIGMDIVKNVLIQGINFISKEDVRDLQLRRS